MLREIYNDKIPLMHVECNSSKLHIQEEFGREDLGLSDWARQPKARGVNFWKCKEEMRRCGMNKIDITKLYLIWN
jgi:hypothetical protein